MKKQFKKILSVIAAAVMLAVSMQTVALAAINSEALRNDTVSYPNTTSNYDTTVSQYNTASHAEAMRDESGVHIPEQNVPRTTAEEARLGTNQTTANPRTGAAMPTAIAVIGLGGLAAAVVARKK